MSKTLKVNQDGIKMEPKDELEVYLLWKQERSYKDIQERVLRPDGDMWSISKIRKLAYKFKAGYVPRINGDDVLDKVTGVEFEKNLTNFDEKKSMIRSFKMAMRLLEKALEDAEKGYVIVDEGKRQIPVKTLVETIEKAGKFWALQKKSEKDAPNSGKASAIDYKEMAKLYVEYKKNPEVNYDAKEHMKDLIEMTSKEDVDKVDEDDDLPFNPSEFDE